ncbi:MAG: radical SAM protein [Candidatus Pacearchaeota archaeon]
MALEEIFETWKSNVEKVIEKNPLNVIHWESTRRCNLRCKHCESPTEGSRDESELTTEQVIKGFRKIRNQIDMSNFSRVLISGGEPFVRKDLVPVVFELGEIGYQNISIQSNGIYIADHPEVLEQLKKTNVTGIGVAVDGLESTHDDFRQMKGSWQKSLRALEYSVDAGFQTTASITAHAKNVDELGELYELLSDRGVNWFKITPIYPLGRTVINQDLLLSPDQTRTLIDFLKTKHRENFRNYADPKTTKVDMGCGDWTGVENEGRFRPYCFFCVAGLNTMTILYDGKITGSNIARDFVEGTLDDDLGKLWNEGFQRYRNRGWLKQDDCGSCGEWDYCKGGPMHLRLPNGTLLSCLYQTLHGKDYRPKIKEIAGEILKCKI